MKIKLIAPARKPEWGDMSKDKITVCFFVIIFLMVGIMSASADTTLGTARGRLGGRQGDGVVLVALVKNDEGMK